LGVHVVNREDLVQEWHVYDNPVEEDRVGDSGNQPHVDEWRGLKERVVLRDCVESIEHLDDNEDRQTQGGGLDLSGEEVIARVFGEIHAFNEVVDLEVSPVGALRPGGELAERDQGVAISSLSHGVPVDENANGGDTNVESDDHVAEEDPVRDQALIRLSGWLLHDVSIRRVETKSGSWRSISDQVDPEELNGVEAFRDSKHGSEEDREDFTYVGRDHVADEGLHVAVDGSTLFNGLDDGGKVVVGKDHVGGLLGNFSASDSHGDTNRSLLDSWSIVDTVTCHSDNFTLINE